MTYMQWTGDNHFNLYRGEKRIGYATASGKTWTIYVNTKHGLTRVITAKSGNELLEALRLL